MDKMRLQGEKDGAPDWLRLYVNEWVYWKNINLKALQFKIEGRSPLEWFVKNFTFKRDKESGIVDDPNHFLPVGEKDKEKVRNYADQLIPRLADVGVSCALAQEEIAKIPLEWQEVQGQVRDYNLHETPLQGRSRRRRR
jgi:predicted helicase